MKSLSTLEVRPARIEDAAIIGANIRQADRLELEASTKLNPTDAIAESIALSVACWTATLDGIPIGSFGVTSISLMGGVGSPWLLGSTECDRVIVPFVRLTRVYIPLMLSLFPRLENLVDVRNVKSIRWLKRLGFTFRDAIPHPHSGAPFHPFEMTRDV